MRRIALSVFALASFSFLACSSPQTTEGSASANSAIIGGATDSGDPAVVEFLMDEGDEEFSCTATFISTQVLITAGHCVTDEGKDPQTIPANAKFSLNLATSGAATGSNAVAVTNSNVHVHPQYDGNGVHDVAIIVLDTPVQVTPIAINRNPLTSADVGKALKLVGYGNNTLKNTGAGTKRTVAATLRALPTTMAEIGVTGKQACEGDSGGPAFMTINGVVTIIATDDLAATNKDCQGGDLYQRVDLQLDFIDTYLGTTDTDTGDPNAADPTDPTATAANTTNPSTTADPTQVASNTPTTPSGDDDDDSASNDPNTPGTAAFCQANPTDDSCAAAAGTANAHSLHRKK